MSQIFEDYWEIKSFRRELPKRFPVIFSTGDPFYEAIDRSSPQLSLYFSYLDNGSKVLDIGAGDKMIELALRKRGIQAEYFSLDTASPNENRYDFTDLDRVDQKDFDLVIMQEVLEHLPLELGYKYLRRSYELLKPGGYLAISVPNIRRPVQFHGADFTHIQHYPLSDLYGILRSIGFSKECVIRGIEIRNPRMGFPERLNRIVQKLLFKLLDFSFPHGIMIKIRKSPGPSAVADPRMI